MPEMTASATMNQKANSCFSSGMVTFMEKTLTMSVGIMMTMVMRFKVFIKIFKLLLTIEARASIRLAKMLE